MRDMLEKKLARFEELEKQMSDPAVQADSMRMANVAREHGSLAKLAHKFRHFKQLNAQIGEAREMLEGDDSEMKELAEAEIPELKEEREALWQELLDATIGGEDANRARCIMEIRAGTGGDEAALFARDLFEMYKRHAANKGWKIEVLESNPTEMGGFSRISLGVEGEGVYRELQYESGGHRVQRVPETETQGRVHTSAATVAVMPEPEDVEIDLKEGRDYSVERYAASSGPGGQHVNKTASAVRLVHVESGLEVKCSDERSQHKNLARAIRRLKAALYDQRRQEEAKKRSDMRKTLVGSGDRSERIRTYNFPQNRLTDHRINFSLYKLDQVMAGDVQPVTDALIDYEREQQRSGIDAGLDE
jgi:peptide chain release factor 1